MVDVLSIGSRLFKGILQKLIVRTIKNSVGIDVNLNLENLTVRHADEENIEFAVSISGSMTEEDFKKLVEKALN